MNLTADQSLWPARLFGRRWWPLWLWILAALTILLTAWFEARGVAATLLLFFLPGWAWLEAWSSRPQEAIWRGSVAAGLSLIFTALGTLYLAYLPGPLTEHYLLGLYAIVTLPPLFIAFRRRHPSLGWPDRRLWLLLVLVLVIAGAIRLPRLGYAEFHEDEVEVTSLAVRTLKGEDYAVFLHRKGPVQMLVPLAEWLLAGRINEGWARLPFALASLLGVLTVSLLAHRVAGWFGGLTTGLLLALNGYFVAFGRMVQYQALIFFLVALAFACLWRVLEEGHSALIWPAALGLAVSLLAHYDALVYLPAVVYLGWRIWRRWPANRLTLLAGSLLAAGVLLSFYVPYLRDPQFEHTQAYLMQSRVGTNWLYNNLKTLRRLDADYSSRFYLPLLWVLSLVVLVRYRPPGRGWWVVLGGALLAAWTTLRWPGIWQLSSLNLALIPWLVLLMVGGVGLRHRQPGYEAIWIWWGVPLLAYLFLVDDPRTHLYVAYPGWALVAGLGAATLWQSVPSLLRKVGPARAFLPAIGGILALLVAGYQAVIFLPTESAWLKLQTEWDGTLGGSLYGSLPKPRTYFGYPRHTGWKAAGWLVDLGRFPGDFRSVGEDFSVPIWYTFETPRSCYDDPQLYLVAQPLNALSDDLRQRLATQYRQAATIYSEGQPRIELFVKGMEVSPLAPDTYDLANIETGFDMAATPDHFASGGQPAQPLEARFGEVAELSGFSLSNHQITAGEVLSVYLYWQSIAETGVAYRAFVHLGENPVWGQHDDDPACRLPMTLWRVGQTAIGQFRVIPSPETPPGDYPLVVGLYHPTTLERLPLLDDQGQSAGDSLILTTVRVVRP
jgi:4-amino-4-deoxy-L-arabinose transferase-like glycosyltransferase